MIQYGSLPDPPPDPPKKRGQPKYEPTESDRATVKNLIAAGAKHENICLCLGKKGISLKTMYKHFRREIDTAKESVTAFAMSGIVKGIQAGDMDAIRLWMRCRAGWKETERHELTGAEGEPIAVSAVSPRQALIAALDGQPDDVKAAVARKLLVIGK